MSWFKRLLKGSPQTPEMDEELADARANLQVTADEAVRTAVVQQVAVGRLNVLLARHDEQEIERARKRLRGER